VFKRLINSCDFTAYLVSSWLTLFFMFYFFRGNYKRILFAWLSFSDSYSVFVNFLLHFIDK